MLLAAEEGATAVNEIITATTGAVSVAWLIPLVPLVGFAAVLLLTNTLRERAAYVAVAAASVSFIVSLAVAVQVIADPATYIVGLGTFFQAMPRDTSTGCVSPSRALRIEFTRWRTKRSCLTSETHTNVEMI
jgi:hypothetical protein